MKHKMYFKEFV